MYWYNSHPYGHPLQSKITAETKYSTTYLTSKIGSYAKVTLNYTSNSVVNQNVQYVGILSEVGNDYFVLKGGKQVGGDNTATPEDEEIMFYTVNLARIRILKNPPAATTPASPSKIRASKLRKQRA